MIDSAPGAISDAGRWYACYTRAHHERRVGERLAEQGFDAFVPTIRQVRQWHDRRKVVEFPLFPSYLFARCTRAELGRATATPGLVHIVKFDGRPVPVADEEIENVRRLSSVMPPTEKEVDLGPIITNGQHVEIVSGPLSRVRGVVAEARGKRRIVVVGILAIRQGLRVEVDRAAVRPLDPDAIGGGGSRRGLLIAPR